MGRKCFSEKTLASVNKLLENKIYIFIMTMLTLYALFGDDARLMLTPKDADPAFYILTAISMVLFAIEVFLASLAQEGYFLGFYFWLDFIATISLVSDIGWVWDPMVGNKELNVSNPQ